DPAAEFGRTVEYIGRSRTVDEERRKDEERRRHHELEQEAERLRAEKAHAEERAAFAEERATHELVRIRQLRAPLVMFVMLAIAGLISAVTFLWQKWEAERALAESRFREAVNRVQRNEPSEALAYLAGAMKHADHPSARLLTASLLLDRTWP